MNKQKFKVGDRVRTVRSCIPFMGGDGRIGEIVKVDLGSALPYCVKLESAGYRPTVWCFEVEHIHEKKKHPVIVITSDGKTATATMRDGKKVLKTASAACSEKDTFDFAEGARIAFERLQGREPFPKEQKPERPEKLVCVKGGCSGYLKAGKVYDVEWRSNCKVFDIVSEVHKFSGEYVDGKYTAPSSSGTAMFIPLVED